MAGLVPRNPATGAADYSQVNYSGQPLPAANPTPAPSNPVGGGGSANPTPTPAATTTPKPNATPAAAPILPTAVAAPAYNGQGNDPTDPGDQATRAAMQTLAETPQQLAADQESYIDAAGKSASASDIISKIEDSFNASISQAGGNAAAAANAGGFAGTAVAGQEETNAKLPIQEQQESAVATAMENIRSQASTDWQNMQSDSVKNAEDTLAAKTASQQNLQTNFKTIAASAAASGTSLTDWVKQNPNEAQYIQSGAYGGDYNAMAAAFAMAAPVDTVVSSWTTGSTYNQLTRNPQTNKIAVQSFDIGTTVPATWTSNKISTTTLMMQDPNNPANTVIYTTDPLTGSVNVTGTGTGTQIAAQYNPGASSSDSGSTTTTPDTGETASTTISTILGVDPTTPLSSVVSNNGIGSVVAALIKNEGGSPAGVQNNPGNVKFTGAAGQTDSGVQATDGGTFASYATPEAGQDAIASLVQDASSGSSSTYGAAPTLQDFVDKYTNTGSAAASSSDTGSNGLSTAEYGSLANVPGFDPGPSTGGTKTDAQAIDSAASNYLRVYLQTGALPTNTNVLGIRSGSAAELPAIAQRARDLYSQATGQGFPDQDILDQNKTLITGNNSLLNSLAVQEGTIQANSDLMQGNITKDNINQNAPIINNVIDGISNALGNPGVASYLAQNSTLSNELGSLLALKNASGTTVHDKLISADLISSDASAEQEAEVVNTLMQEAQNAHAAISTANAKLYLQVDPLGLDPQNPLSDPTSFASSVGLNLDAIKQDYPDMTDSQIIQQYLQSN